MEVSGAKHVPEMYRNIVNQEIQNLVQRTSQVLNILYRMTEQSFEGKSSQTLQAYKTTIFLYKV